MQKKVQRILSVICILICVLCLLGFSQQKKSYFQETGQLISFGRDNVGLNALIDKCVIYEVSENPSSETVFYRYYMDTNKTVKIGSISNLIVADRGTTILDHVYYFYATIARGETLVDILYAIDLEKNTLTAIEEDSTYTHLIPVQNMNGKLIALKGDIYANHGYSKTYMYEYDPKTGQGREVLENRITLKDLKGNAFVTFTCHNDQLYAVVDSGGQKKNISIKVYDKNYILKKTFSIKELGELFPEGIMEINVKGDYIHLLGMGDRSAIVKMKENKIEIIDKSTYDSLEVFFDPQGIQTNQWFFFKRFSNDLFILNLDTGVLTKEIRTFQKDYQNWYGMVGENGIFIASVISGDAPFDNKRPRYIYHYLDMETKK